jgi:hypothetical protein
MPKYHTRYVKEHYVKRDIKRELYERFIKWCGERSINICLEKALSILEANIGANIAPNTGASQTKPVANSSGGYEWCRPRSSIKNLEGFIKYVERSLGLEDWWEEGDKVCFKTAKRPAKL